MTVTETYGLAHQRELREMRRVYEAQGPGVGPAVCEMARRAVYEGTWPEGMTPPTWAERVAACRTCDHDGWSSAYAAEVGEVRERCRHYSAAIDLIAAYLIHLPYGHPAARLAS